MAYSHSWHPPRLVQSALLLIARGRAACEHARIGFDEGLMPAIGADEDVEMEDIAICVGNGFFHGAIGIHRMCSGEWHIALYDGLAVDDGCRA